MYVISQSLLPTVDEAEMKKMDSEIAQLQEAQKATQQECQSLQSGLFCQLQLKKRQNWLSPLIPLLFHWVCLDAMDTTVYTEVDSLKSSLTLEEIQAKLKSLDTEVR